MRRSMRHRLGRCPFLPVDAAPSVDTHLSRLRRHRYADRAAMCGKASFATLTHVVVHKIDHYRPPIARRRSCRAGSRRDQPLVPPHWSDQAKHLLDPIVSRTSRLRTTADYESGGRRQSEEQPSTSEFARLSWDQRLVLRHAVTCAQFAGRELVASRADSLGSVSL